MSHEPIDFEKLVAQVMEPRHWVGKEAFAIWGGNCAEANLEKFLRDWNIPNAQMNYVVWETISDLRLRDWQDAQVQFTAARLNDLERARIFGAQGDLSLIRGDDGFRWYFVGDVGQTPPAGYAESENNFFASEPSARFLRRTEHAMLWGEWKPDAPRWFEDRVARADLNYPLPVPLAAAQSAWRAQIEFETFSRAGAIEFVWFKRLTRVQVKEANND